MGAGVSTRRGASSRTVPAETTTTPASTPAPPAAAPPPARSAAFGARRTTRSNLEATINNLVTDLSATKEKLASTEGKLQARLETELQQGVPRTECVVCMAACVSTVLLPCGHLCVCSGCATSLKAASKSLLCPLCRQPVQNTHRIYLPVEGQPVALPQPPPPPLQPQPQQPAPQRVAATAARILAISADAEVQVTPIGTPVASPASGRQTSSSSSAATAAVNGFSTGGAHASFLSPRPPLQVSVVNSSSVAAASMGSGRGAITSPPLQNRQQQQQNRRIVKRPSSARARNSDDPEFSAHNANNPAASPRPATAMRVMRTGGGGHPRPQNAPLFGSGSGGGAVGDSPRVPSSFDFVLPGGTAIRNENVNPFAMTWS